MEEIGHGGMATVYRARDRRLGRDVAVKVIHHHLRENREVAQRFESEARAVAKLKHPNIVEVYDVSDAQDDERYLVVELVRGTTLRKLLAAEGHLPPEVAAAVGIELADALEHAHGMGVIHRDIKPENVLIRVTVPDSERERSRVKLTDFGIAKLLDAQGVTSTGQVLGSPAHMAPEQIEGGEVTARADVFGLGVLLYECMVGRLPFDGKNPAQVLRRVLDGAFTPPERARPTVGATYSAVLARALAHEPKDRYDSTSALAHDLRAELLAMGIEQPALELHQFLEAPAAYRAAEAARVVERLRKNAEGLRGQGKVVEAAACFNRALAYRPNDGELLRALSRLNRGARTRRVLLRGASTIAGVLGVAGAVVAVARMQTTPKREAKADVPTALVRSAEPIPVSSFAVVSSSARAQPSSPESPPDSAPSGAPTARKNPRSGSSKPAPASSAEGAPLAHVQILVDGPQSAIVRVDGIETSWFGRLRSMPPGPHTFEFVAPDETCCEPGQTLKVNIPVPVNENDVTTVRGRIEFRPAMLELSGPAGSLASCGALGEFPVPGQRQIPMAGAVRRVRCQLIPPPGSAEPPKEFDVTLRAGRLSTNLGQ
ncbi:MAG TPA: serine/threonine-protein kinase [Polyangiaceae bacterium]|nr:serine/threonine-protein kinase [Polyangiaceae bacterium]